VSFGRTRLGDVVTYLQRGKSPTYSEKGRVRVINQKCIRWRGIDLRHARYIDDSKANEFASTRYLLAGDVLVNSTGEGTIGRANVWQGDCKGQWVADSHVTVIRPSTKLDGTWLKFWLESTEGQEFVSSSKTGATKQTELSSSKLKECSIPLPDLMEQLKVVSRIKDCMVRVDEMETLRGASRAQQQYLSASLIESELHPELTNVDGWRIHSVGELVTSVRNGRSIAQDTEGRADGGVLTLTAVRSIDLGIEHQKPIALPDTVAQQFGIDEGDVFVSRANTIELVGLSAVAEEKPAARLIYPDLLIKLKADRSKILPRYLAYALRSASARKQIKARALGSSQTMVKISGERLREVTLPVPSLDKQAEIIDRLDDAHELTRELVAESVSGEMEALRGAILRKAFAGEL
jgi:type I restriction enzyme S subunit